MPRFDGRTFDNIRDAKIEDEYLTHPDASVLIQMGETKVICTAFIEDKVPYFLRNSGQGWVTAEYDMLPGSTESRKMRAAKKGKQDGRSQEIQRLIGRSLRSVVDLNGFGERTLWIDCDVIQADGGTRTAAITGSFVAMVQAFNKLKDENLIDKIPAKNFVSAISVGVVNEENLLDLCYEEDKNAKVDMNIVMTNREEFVEIQGTGEESPFSMGELMNLLELAKKGCNDLFDIQKNVLGKEITKEIMED
ncbi:MAG: ribonuclease PH [Eubacteriales bacterium]